MPKISIIIPAHNEERNLDKLFSKLIPVLEHHSETQDFELIIVNDNSTDSTTSIADEFSQRDKRIKAIHRNSSPGFGNAIKEGFKNAAGDILIPVMGDLSDDPKDIADKILFLAGDEKLRESIGKRARETARNCSWDKIADRAMKVYREILCGK